MVFANDMRLHLAHHEIMTQGRMVEEALRDVRTSNEARVRYEELNWATGCCGLSTPISILEYTDATTFIEYHVAHCMPLGLHSQIMRQMRDVIGDDDFNNVCKRADKRIRFILRPSVMKRHVKRLLPESSFNFLSG